MDNNRSLISLAVIKTIWDQRRADYIETFIPLLATLMCEKQYKTVKVNELCADFEKRYGLIIPYHPMITILNRARQRKIIEKVQTEERVNLEEARKFNITKKSEDKEKEHEQIIDKFILFIKEKYDIEMSRTDAENALLIFLKSHDLDLIFALGHNSVLPSIRLSKRGIFFFSRFIQSISTTNIQMFRQIVNIALGHILASALLYGGDFKVQYEVGMKKQKIFLDTRFVLRLLGIEGEARRIAYEEFLKVILQNGAELYIFEHTKDEIDRVLENCFTWVENPRYDPRKASIAIRYCVENQFGESDVQILINRLDSLLKKYKINITPVPVPSEYQAYQIDDIKLRQCIVDVYKEQNLSFDEAEKDFSIQRDISSISAVYKLRNGKRPRNLKEAECFFPEFFSEFDLKPLALQLS